MVVCRNETSLDICDTIDEFRCKQGENEELLFNNDYKFIVDLNSLKEFSEKTQATYEKLYLFLLENEEKYRKLLNKSFLFRKDEPDLFYSPFFSNLKKVHYFFQVRFFIKCLFLRIKKIGKIFGPIIFLFDLVENNYQSFNTYMDYKSRLADYNKKSMKSQILFYAQSEKGFEKSKAEIENKFNQAKENYLNSTLNNFNLFVAIIGLIISIFINILLVNINNNERSMMQNTLDELRKENIDIKQSVSDLDFLLNQHQIEINRKDELITILRNEIEIFIKLSDREVEE